MLAPVFTHDNVKRMDEEVRGTANKLVTALREHVQAHSSEVVGDNSADTAQINALEWMSRATLDIIGSVGFGHDFQLGRSPEAQAISKSWLGLVEMGMTLPAFIALMVIRAVPQITSLPVEAIQAQGEIKTIIARLARTIVEQRKQLEEGGETRGKDLLSTMLRMQEMHGESFEQIIDHVSPS